MMIPGVNYPVDTGRKLNVHKTFRRRPGRLLNVLCTFNLHPVSTGYVIYGYFSARATPGISLYWGLTFEENIVAIITQDRVIDDNLRRQIKSQTLCTCRLFLLT